MNDIVEKSEIAFEVWWGNRPQSTPEEQLLKLHTKHLFMEGCRVGYTLGVEQSEQLVRKHFGRPDVPPPPTSFLGEIFGGL